MVVLPQLLLLAGMSLAPPTPSFLASSPGLIGDIRVETHVVAPQDAGGRKGTAPVGGGTPEPVTLLLLAGGALGYGALRLRRNRGKDS